LKNNNIDYVIMYTWRERERGR